MLSRKGCRRCHKGVRRAEAELPAVVEPASPGSYDAKLFQRLYPGLRRFAAVCGDADLDPDDLVQEAIARALRLGPLSELTNPAAYLRRSVANVASNSRRRLGRQRALLTRLGADTNVQPTYPSDLADLERLASTDRAVLYLVEVEGATLAEAATTLGISVLAARARASRARRRLRHQLEQEDR